MADDVDTLLMDAMLKEIELESARQAFNKVRAEKEEVNDGIRAVQQESAEIIQDLRIKMREEQERADAIVRAEKERLAEIEGRRWDAQLEAKRLEREYESLQRQIDQARRAALKTGEWKALEARWDAMTMGAPWREWAKDHQITGGKKCTYEGRIILADTMGLGKTLTSLVTIDMIQAATKDAREDNPIEFGRM